MNSDDSKKGNFVDRLLSDYHISLLILILLVGAGLRIAAFLSIKETAYYDYLLWDEKLYHDSAVQIASGKFNLQRVYDFAPLFTYIVAAIYKLFSPDIVWVRIFNIILGSITCLWIYYIGKNLSGRIVGLAACLIAALYEPFIFYSVVPLKVSLSIFTFALFCALLTLFCRRPHLATAIGLGFVAGILPTIRENYLVLLPLVMFVVGYVYYKNTGEIKKVVTGTVLCTVGFILALLPFMIRNYRVSGQFSLTTSQAGFNFYIGNNTGTVEPYFRPVPFALPIPAVQPMHFAVEASRRSGEVITPERSSRFWIMETIRETLEKPGVFSRRMLNKTMAMLNEFEAGDHYNIDFMSRFAEFFKLPFIPFWLVLPFGFTGIIFTWKRSISHRVLAVSAMLYASTVVLFFVNTRYRLPLLVILIPFAVAGAQKFYEQIKDRKKTLLFAGCLIILFFVEFLSFPGRGDMTAYYNTHAMMLQGKGESESALAYWEESSLQNGAFSCFADLSLAKQSFRKKNLIGANEYLDRIPEGSFAEAVKYKMKGDIYARENKDDLAVTAYRKALEINSGLVEINRKIERLNGERGNL